MGVGCPRVPPENAKRALLPPAVFAIDWPFEPMSKDPTFRVLGTEPTRSERYQAYREEWNRREADLDAADHPVHVDLETVAVCDLRCGSS